ncbi:MAG: alpha/beta hydrolase [Opitutaceae bacterium]
MKSAFLILLTCAPVYLFAASDSTQPSERQKGDEPSLRVMPNNEVYAKRQLRRNDTSRDGLITEEEAGVGNWRKFKALDLDASGSVDLEELKHLKLPELPTSGEKQLNVLYKNLPEESLYLDLYYPLGVAKGDLPVVVFTHGGGWAAGSKEGAAMGAHKDLFLKVLEEGFCVAAVNYRLVGMHKGNYVPECVADCKDAVRYLAKNADAFGIDPHSFFTVGNSAGGHLSMMLLLSPKDEQLGDPALAGIDYTMVAGVSWYGWANLKLPELFIKPGKPVTADPLRGTHSRVLRSGLTEEGRVQVVHEMSPSTWLTKDSAPLFMLHGTEDTTIIDKHAYWMKDLADKRGADVEILIVQGAGHGWEAKGIQPTKEEVIQATVDFFVKHKP